MSTRCTAGRREPARVLHVAVDLRLLDVGGLLISRAKLRLGAIMNRQTPDGRRNPSPQCQGC